MNIPQFLTEALSRDDGTPTAVTLTFAQSLDAKIAGKDGQQLILSGKESMVMTHWMRTMHDAILVGIGTALNDNPQLNTRHLPHREPNPEVNGHPFPYHLPRPIVLDAQLRFSPTCKLLQNYRAGSGRRPYIFTTNTPKASPDEWEIKIHNLESHGAKVFSIAEDEDGLLLIPSLLETLSKIGLHSLMVEGGARVIASFIKHPEVLTSVIVTVAPKFVGAQGVGYDMESSQVFSLKHHATECFGVDTVVSLKPKHLDIAYA